MGCCALPRIDLDDQFGREDEVGSKHVLSVSIIHSSHLQSKELGLSLRTPRIKWAEIPINFVRGDRELFIHSGGHAIKQTSDPSM